MNVNADVHTYKLKISASARHHALWIDLQNLSGYEHHEGYVDAKVKETMGKKVFSIIVIIKVYREVLIIHKNISHTPS